jgi:hypothetical protein
MSLIYTFVANSYINSVELGDIKDTPCLPWSAFMEQPNASE